MKEETVCGKSFYANEHLFFGLYCLTRGKADKALINISFDFDSLTNDQASIRQICLYYFKASKAGSMDRYLMSFLVNKWRLSNGLSSLYVDELDIFKDLIYAPGDFSGLDLSGLDFSRSSDDHGNFKAVHMKGSNLKGTVWNNVYGHSWHLDGADLEGADFSGMVQRDLIIIGANIKDAFFGENWVPDRRALNYQLYRKTKEI
jgi:uncharacterized protein YjbI with pentapeptide repeats